MIGLLICDVDGTLINSEKKLPENARILLKKIRSRGCGFSIASGRGLSSLGTILDELAVDLPLISSGGGCVANHKNKKIFFRFCISIPDRNKLVNIVNDHPNRGILFQYENRIIGDSNACETYHNWFKSPKPEEYNLLTDPLLPAPIKIDVYGNREVLKPIHARVIKEVPGIQVSSWSDSSLEFTTHGVDKGSGLEHLANLINYRLDRIAVFGDSDNDIPLFRKAGYKVALGNSPRELKELADYVAPHVDEDGLANGLKNVMPLLTP